MRRHHPDEYGGGEEMRIIMGELGVGLMRAQVTLILSYMDGTSHAAIAKILGRGAVRRNLGRRASAKRLFSDDVRVRVRARPLGDVASCV